jgi:ribosomal protein S18 acetylase RimI-like enzyme
MSVTIRRGLTEDQLAAAARLYWQAYGPKLGRVLGPEEKALRFLSRAIRADRCLVATDGRGGLLGLAGYRTRDASFAGGTANDLGAIYGRVGGWWRMLILHLLSDEAEAERFLLDGLCVAAEARGQGIGTLLLEAICDEARQRGFPAVRLDVIDNNRRAIALYQRQGFVTQGTARLGPLRFVFGFRATHRMVRSL